jgi:hypothetical protein
MKAEARKLKWERDEIEKDETFGLIRRKEIDSTNTNGYNSHNDTNKYLIFWCL